MKAQKECMTFFKQITGRYRMSLRSLNIRHSEFFASTFKRLQHSSEVRTFARSYSKCSEVVSQQARVECRLHEGRVTCASPRHSRVSKKNSHWIIITQLFFFLFYYFHINPPPNIPVKKELFPAPTTQFYNYVICTWTHTHLWLKTQHHPCLALLKFPNGFPQTWGWPPASVSTDCYSLPPMLQSYRATCPNS